MPDALAPQPNAAPVPAPGNDNFAALLKNINAGQDNTNQLLASEQKEMAGPMSAAGGILASPRPASPQLQAAPKAPEMQKEQGESAKNFAMVATLVAGIMGAASRQHVTTALNAFGSAIKGYKEGQFQAAAQAHNEWKDASDAASANNKAMLEEYNAALSDRKASLDEQMARIQMIATRYHDPITAQAAEAKNYLLIGQLAEKQREASEKFDLATAKLTQQHEEFTKKLNAQLAGKGMKLDGDNIVADPDSPITKGKADMSSASLDYAAARYITTNSIPAGMGGSQMRTQVMNRAAEMLQSAGISPEQFAALPQEKKADASALARDTAWLDGVERQQEILKGMLPIVEGYMQKLPLTEIQRVNAAIVAGQKEFGSPDANAYANAMTTLALEYGRLTAGPQSAAMLPVEVVKLGMNRFGGMTPDQFATEKVLVGQEADNSVKAQTKIIDRRRSSLQSLFTPAPAVTPTASATAAPAAGAPKEGQTGTSKSGKPIIFQNGQWEYAQ